MELVNRRLNEKMEKIFIITIFTAFMGQIYVNPFASEFRLTLAVVTLNILLLVFDDTNVFVVTNLVGLLMLTTRSIVFLVENPTVNYFFAIQLYLPVLIFYVFYGILFNMLNIRGSLANPLLLSLGLWICDAIPNILELIVRGQYGATDLNEVILTIILIALFRAFVTMILIYISKYYYENLQLRRKTEKFMDQINLISSLNTELFFLRKSRKDIENTMENSFQIYEEMENNYLKNKLLRVTNDIHEIKKDYTRVIAGIEKNIESVDTYTMNIKKILSLVFKTNQVIAENRGKNIKMKLFQKINFETTEYLVLISILNNIVINSIDAIENKGEISFYVNDDDHEIFITIQDDGEGICVTDIPLIFEPGFSTKYNKVSGIMSSGVGLTHLRYLVEDVLNGKVTVESKRHKGTSFRMSFPKADLIYEEGENGL